MGIVYEFSGDVILFRAGGELTNDTIDKALEDATKDPRFRPGMYILMEDRGSEYHPSSDDAYEAAANLQRLMVHYSPHIAVVVKREAQYGMGRMISAYCEQHGIDLQIFRNVDNAREWLTLVRRECRTDGGGPS